jgi:hypothetical protein
MNPRQLLQVSRLGQHPAKLSHGPPPENWEFGQSKLLINHLLILVANLRLLLHY